MLPSWSLQRPPPKWVAPLIPASTLGALLIPVLPFVVPSSEVSLARIWGLGARRAGKFTEVASIVKPPQSSADDGLTAMDKLLFWLGIGAAQKGAGSKPTVPSRHWVVSLVVGILIVVLIAIGMFLLLVSQKL